MIDQDVLKKYVVRRQDDFEKCLEAVGQSSFSTIEMIGHKMKGNGVTFGFPELSELGESLENAAIERDMDAIKKRLADFKRWLSTQSHLAH